MVGYLLIGVAILLGAIILVYSAYGYGINTKTGDIVQNGLLFVDSQPGGAEIYLNGQDKGAKTASRLILTAGAYNLRLKKSGYHDWSRSFSLTEHAVSRYVYPFLFPTSPVQFNLKNYSSLPPLITQSPDRRWVLVQTPESSSGNPVFDEYDTTNLKQGSKAVSFPAGLLTGSTISGSQLKMVEWSTDNKNVLLEHIYPGGTEFVVFNRDDPTISFNVNKIFSTSPTQVTLRDKKTDQLYLYNQASQNLGVGNVSTGEVTPLLNKVLAFKPSGTDLIIYVTDQNSKAGEVTARIWNNSQTYPLYSFAVGEHYLLDMAQYQGDWFYVAGSDKSGRVNIYKNPLDTLKNTALAKALPMTSLRQSGADKVAFSSNTRFVEAEAGQSFAVYDFETQTSFHYTLPKALTSNMHWMDGHRLIGNSGGTAYVTDYDSTNQNTLVAVSSSDDIYFDSNYTHMFSLAPASSGVTLFDTDMRAGTDLPANQF